jgi:hypothetical protein
MTKTVFALDGMGLYFVRAKTPVILIRSWPC